MVSSSRRLAVALLRPPEPDHVRVLGAGHPDTLTTRSNIAFWTSRCREPPPS